jgi:hypothetical protein
MNQSVLIVDDSLAGPEIRGVSVDAQVLGRAGGRVTTRIAEKCGQVVDRRQRPAKSGDAAQFRNRARAGRDFDIGEKAGDFRHADGVSATRKTNGNELDLFVRAGLNGRCERLIESSSEFRGASGGDWFEWGVHEATALASIKSKTSAGTRRAAWRTRSNSLSSVPIAAIASWNASRPSGGSVCTT